MFTSLGVNVLMFLVKGTGLLPDFIPWEPGTSYQFYRKEVKKDGGKCERRLAQNGFCSSKKSHK